MHHSDPDQTFPPCSLPYQVLSSLIKSQCHAQCRQRTKAVYKVMNSEPRKTPKSEETIAMTVIDEKTKDKDTDTIDSARDSSSEVS